MKLRANEVRMKNSGKTKEGYTSSIKWIFMLALLVVITMVVPNGKMAHAEVIGVLTSDGYSFDTETGKLTITTDSGTTSWSSNSKIVKNDIKLVELCDGVKSINSLAFYNCTSLKKVVISESVTSIRNDAFYKCTGLEEIVIPESVTSIGSGVFQSCTSLKTIVIPKGVTGISNTLFLNCENLESAEIPEGITSIGESAFKNCYGLKEVVIPMGVESIGKNAFDTCMSLESIEIPESVTSIGDKAFSFCVKLKKVVLKEGMVKIGNDVFSYCSKLEEVTIPSSVESISISVFYSCENITTVNVPNGTLTIERNLSYGGSAYIALNSITNFSIKGKVWTGFERSEWESSNPIENPNADSITYEMPPNTGTVTFGTSFEPLPTTVVIIESVDGEDYNSSGKTLSLKQGDLTYPATNYGGVKVFTNIPEGLYSIYIGDVDTGRTIDKVDTMAVVDTLDFYMIQFAVNDAGSAKNSTICATYNSAEITSGTVVFAGGELVITVKGEGGADSYTYTWSGAEASENTDTITIESLREGVNVSCVVTGKKASTSDPTPTPTPDTTPTTEPEVEPEPVVIAKVDMVRLTPSVATVIQGKTKSFTAKVIGTEEVSQDVTWTVEGNTSSSTVISADGVLTVGKDEKATSVIVKVTSKEDVTKSAQVTVKVVAKKGTTFTAGNYTYIITDDSFDGTGTVTLTGVAKGKTVTTVNVPETAKYKGFEYDVTAIGEKAFYQNKNIKKATIGNNVTVIGKNSFRECPNLTEVTVGDDVVTISYGAFYKCTALKKITIGTGLQEIGNHAFCHDKALETIIISSTKLKKLGDHVLYANTKLTIKVPSSKVSAYEKLFTKTAQGKKVVVVKK